MDKMDMGVIRVFASLRPGLAAMEIKSRCAFLRVRQA